MTTNGPRPAPPPHRPKPAAKPSMIRVYRTICAYASDDANHLAYDEDDIVFVDGAQEDANGYIHAKIGDRKGMVNVAHRE